MRPLCLAVVGLLALPGAARAGDFDPSAHIDKFQHHESQSAPAGATGSQAPRCAPPSTPAGNGGGRRGMGLSHQAFAKKPDLAKEILERLQSEWYYTWSDNKFDGARGEFIPMLFNAATADDVIALVKKDHPRAVLGFNEPDIGYNAGDKTIKVPLDEALKVWPRVAQAIPPAPEVELGSPAPAMNGGDWWKGFEASQPRVDFVAIHWYGAPDLEQFKKAVIRAYNQYCRPIWVTEFGVYDHQAVDVNPADKETLARRYHFKYRPTPQAYLDKLKAQHLPTDQPNKYTERDAEKFMREALAWLDGAEGRAYVERYAWNSPGYDNIPATNATDVLLYVDESGKLRLTDLGKIYAGRE